ncbi:hypothetical protein [Nocardia sp. NPDC050718]|uniref:immunity protein Imm33 domain-containing protein n=1 Tax=Nocardia sp. NPDC050718 TaxID=3155788 RepID=UPI0033DDC0C0
MEQRRTAAGVAGQAEFTLEYEYDIVTELGIDWLVSWLEDSIRAGSRFTPAQTVTIGWLNCYVIENADGTLGLCEPDFENVPPILAAGASKAVGQLWYQREVAESVGLGDELDFPHYTHRAVTCDAFADSGGVVMYRYPHNEHYDDFSGWFVGCSGLAHEHDDTTMRSTTLYELAVINPSIVGYLALPHDCSVDTSDGAPEIWRNGEPLTVRDGSLLAASFHRDE